MKLLGIVVAAALWGAIGSAVAQERVHDPGHEHGGEELHGHGAVPRGSRLAVADALSNTVRVVDIDSGSVVGSFTVPGETGGNLVASSSGQYAVVAHRDANRISIIHSGLISEEHGNHAHLHQGSPYVLATMNVGRQPTHLTTAGGSVLVFNDQDGSIAILDENLLGLTLNHDLIEAAQPDHGAALLLGDFVLAGYLEGARVDVYDRNNNLIDSGEGCPGLHGAIAVDEVAVFGCADGVLLAELHGDHFHWRHIANPTGTPEGTRIGTFYGALNGVAIGNFGSGLALVDLENEAINQMALPADPLSAVLAGDLLAVVNAAGGVGLYELHGDHLHELDLLVEFVVHDPAAGRPAVTAIGGTVFISDPAAGVIHVLQAGHDGFEPGDDIVVPGHPGQLAPLMLQGEFEWH